MTDETAKFNSRIAHLNEADRDDYNHIVHGVAHGEGELTNGLNGPKYWPPEEVASAAASLEGKPVYRVHDDGDREEIGAVLRSGYQEGVGVLYEAGLNDSEIAEELSLGQREVSIEAGNPSSVERHEDTGAAILREYEYTGLATPKKGASEGNYTAAGSADDNPAVAALSAGDIEGALGGDDPEPDDPEQGEVSGSEGTMGAESPVDTDSTMSEDDTTETEPDNPGPDVEALLERVDEKDERIESLEAELEEKEEQIQEVAEAYAAALATEDSPFTADEYAEKFDVAELREKFDERDAELAETPEPDVQSGGGEDPEEAELSENEKEEEIAALEQKAEVFANTAAGEKYEERLAELTED